MNRTIRTALPLILAGLFVASAARCVPASSRSDESPQPAQPSSARSSNQGDQPELTIHAAPKPLDPSAVTNDWPNWRGPTHDLISSETKLLKNWPEKGPTLLWEVGKGSGYATPAVVGDRLILFHRLGNSEIVECLHAETGRRFWKFTYPSNYKDRYEFQNGPRAGPVVDEGRVYTYGAEGKLHCFDLQTGKVLWTRHASSEFKVPQDFFGVGASPLVDGDLLIVNVGAPGGPCVVAFNKVTGATVWRAGDQWGPSYASPTPAIIHGNRRILVFAGGDSDPPTGGLLSIIPATGEIVTRFPFRSKTYTSVNAASPLTIGNQVFLSTAYRTGCALINIRPDGQPDIAWKNSNLQTHFSTPIHRNGYIYGFDGLTQSNAIVCLDVKTGEQLWSHVPAWTETIEVNGKPREIRTQIYRGSLVWADGHFLGLGEEGQLLWLDLTPDGYRELARTRLFMAGETWSTPVISRGLLYIGQNKRDEMNGSPQRLLCYDLRAPAR